MTIWKISHKLMVIGVVLVSTLSTTACSQSADQSQPESLKNRSVTRVLTLLEVHHQLQSLPNYGVFDWLDAQMPSEGRIVLRGQIVEPLVKTEAESRVKELDGVTSVENDIEVLPASRSDERLRSKVYKAVYSYDSELSRYTVMSVLRIHIIIENGVVTLQGSVRSEADSRLAYTAAQGVQGVLALHNDLEVEQDLLLKDRPQ